MKNIVKMLGIIALLAIVGLAVSCETDAEDQTTITLTGFPENAAGYSGYIYLSKTKAGDADGDIVGHAAAAKAISGGELTNEMLDMKDGIYGENDDLFVLVGVGQTATEAQANIVFRSDSKQGVKKGENTFDMKVFSPAPSKFFGAEDAAAKYFGSYSTTYKLGDDNAHKEYVDVAKASFSIYEKKGETKDPENYIDFDISEGWLFADVPSGGDYTVGFKFTGVIKAGAKVTGTYIYGSKSAPGFGQADIGVTEASMFLFFKADGTFVRTVFFKTAGTEAKTIITGDDSAIRVYAK